METLKKFVGRFSEEKANILDAMNNCGKDCSNLSDYYISALDFSSKLPTVWDLSPVSVKEKIQELIFPDGILYNHKNQSFRTEKVNEVFLHIASLTSNTEGNKNGQPNKIIELSSQVGTTGFEPATT